MIGARSIDGEAALTLGSPRSDLEATFVPGAGMVCCCLRHRGEELLGQRRGLGAYMREQATMGIPLLHPWANRLGSERFRVGGREVALEGATLPMLRDDTGLPIHGLLSGVAGWRVIRHEPVPGGAALAATLDFAADARRIAAFPFAHELVYEATLVDATLEIAVTVIAGPDCVVPISLGFHPYLRLPSVARRDWVIDAPVDERVVLDGRRLPNGRREPAAVAGGRLGARTFDDEYLAPRERAPFTLRGGGRRIALAVESGYRYAQIFAPPDDDVIAFEPMTAPTNALVSGGSELPLLAAGERYRARFTVTVTDEP